MKEKIPGCDTGANALQQGGDMQVTPATPDRCGNDTESLGLAVLGEPCGLLGCESGLRVLRDHGLAAVVQDDLCRGAPSVVFVATLRVERAHLSR